MNKDYTVKGKLDLTELEELKQQIQILQSKVTELYADKECLVSKDGIIQAISAGVNNAVNSNAASNDEVKLNRATRNELINELNKRESITAIKVNKDCGANIKTMNGSTAVLGDAYIYVVRPHK